MHSKTNSQQFLNKRQRWKTTIITIIFWDFFMLDEISPQGKQSVIITNRHGLYEFPHDLPNDVILRILGN